MAFKIEQEFVDGSLFKLIDKEVSRKTSPVIVFLLFQGKSVYSRITEITLKIDPDGWILCWEYTRKVTLNLILNAIRSISAF